MNEDNHVDYYFNEQDASDHSESELFRVAVQDVTPLPSSPLISHITPCKHRTPESTLRLRRKLAAAPANKHDGLSNHDANPVAPEAFISFRHPSLSPGLFSALRMGKKPVEYTLDLHGYTVEEARITIIHFLLFCQKNHYQCVKIIHGKSHKNYETQVLTLKSFVARWLTQLPAILAYVSCLPKDGGCGAVYVLLKRKR